MVYGLIKIGELFVISIGYLVGLKCTLYKIESKPRNLRSTAGEAELSIKYAITDTQIVFFEILRILYLIFVKLAVLRRSFRQLLFWATIS